MWPFDHVVPLASSMELLHLIGQDNQNEVQHNLWSCDAIGVCIMVM